MRACCTFHTTSFFSNQTTDRQASELGSSVLWPCTSGYFGIPDICMVFFMCVGGGAGGSGAIEYFLSRYNI